MEPMQILAIALFALFFVLAVFPPNLGFGIRAGLLLLLGGIGFALGSVEPTMWTATIPTPAGDLGGGLWGIAGFVLGMIVATIAHFVRKKKSAAA